MIMAWPKDHNELRAKRSSMCKEEVDGVFEISLYHNGNWEIRLNFCSAYLPSQPGFIALTILGPTTMTRNNGPAMCLSGTSTTDLFVALPQNFKTANDSSATNFHCSTI